MQTLVSWRKLAGACVALLVVGASGCTEPAFENYPQRTASPPPPPQWHPRPTPPVAAAPVIRPAALHRVVKVRDGDSLRLDSDGVQHEVRLAGIDAPELRQDFGRDAKAQLSALVQGKEISFSDAGQDSYHRNLVHLYANGVDVNLEMVRRGLAWHYRAYSTDPGLAAAEQEARKFHRGVWSAPNPVPPWQWRHRQ